MAGEVQLKINTRTGKISLEGVGFQGDACTSDLGALSELFKFTTKIRKPKTKKRIAVRTAKVGRR